MGQAADRETPGLVADHAHFLAVVEGDTDRLGERELPCVSGIGVLNTGRQCRAPRAFDKGRRRGDRDGCGGRMSRSR